MRKLLQIAIVSCIAASSFFGASDIFQISAQNIACG